MLRIESELPAIDKKIGDSIAKATKLERAESQESNKLHQASLEEKEALDLLQEVEEMVCIKCTICLANEPQIRLQDDLHALGREIRDEEAKLKRVSADSRTPEEA
jgi:hypothetical protein